MKNTTQFKHLSEVLSISDIENSPNNICIISGVGSGKNYFVENILAANKSNQMKNGNILYIISRRAKVNEILVNEFCQPMIKWDAYNTECVTLTNYEVERIVKNQRYTKNIDDIISHFAYIVIDEAHSTATDSTFASSSFHVLSLIEYVQNNHQTVKIILMTGTPEPISNYLKQGNWTTFDMRDKCINVLPQKVQVIDRKEAIKLINNLPDGQKTLYMTTSATGIVSDKGLVHTITKEGIISEDEISFCMSKSSSERLKSEIKNDWLERNTKTFDYLAQNHKFPDNIKIVLATSTLKEGVNIKDNNIHIAFCESHLLSDIMQFGGRVRNGLDTLYIIENAKQNVLHQTELVRRELELLYCYKYGDECSNINRFYNEHILDDNSDIYRLTNYSSESVSDYNAIRLFDNYSAYTHLASAKDFIDLIESKFKAIRFNHLTNEFNLNYMNFAESKRIYIELNSNWINNIKQYCEHNNIIFESPVVMTSYEIRQAATELLSESYKNNILYANQSKDNFSTNLCSILGINVNARLKSINAKLQEYDVPYVILNKQKRVDGLNRQCWLVSQKN